MSLISFIPVHKRPLTDILKECSEYQIDEQKINQNLKNDKCLCELPMTQYQVILPHPHHTLKRLGILTAPLTTADSGEAGDILRGTGMRIRPNDTTTHRKGLDLRVQQIGSDPIFSKQGLTP